MHNALDPNLMTPAERLAEISEILAAGILRLRAKAQHTTSKRDISLDFSASQSVHARKKKRRENNGKQRVSATRSIAV